MLKIMIAYPTSICHWKKNPCIVVPWDEMKSG